MMRALRSLFAGRQETRALAQALSLSATTQAVSSGTNFAMGIYLVRVLEPFEFGLYGIGFAVCLVVSAIGGALITTQMVVHLPNKDSRARVGYAGRMFVAITLIVGGPAVLIGAWIGLSELGRLYFDSVSRLYFVAVGVASAGNLTREFMVRYAYSERREYWSLIISLSIAACMGLLICLAHARNGPVAADSALLIYGFSHLLGAAVGYRLSGIRMRIIPWSAIRSDLSEGWVGGRWAVITSILYTARAQAHTLIVASVLGPVGLAKLNAARLFVTPIIMVTPAITQVVLPRMVAARRDATGAFSRLRKLLTLVLVLMAVCYSLLILLGFDIFSALLVGGRYESIFPIVMAWILFSCVLAMRNAQEVAVQAARGFKFEAKASLVAMTVTILAVMALLEALGEVGAVLGLVVGELALVYMYQKHSA